MVKSVLGVNHQGLRDWLIQRISAVYMTVYLIALVVFLIVHPDIAYYDWQSLFAEWWMKIATMMCVSLLLFHAWIGMWTVFTDYVTCSIARLTLNTLVLLALAGFFFAALLILWGV
ncbi:MAG: succinate dehydrogenase, hydrophobic membrane anchor protein [Gammaproteobacteria bacterium]